MTTQFQQLTINTTLVDVDLGELVNRDHADVGRIIGFGFAHKPFYPEQSGPVFHFELVDGRTVEVQPWDTQWRAVWVPDGQAAHFADLPDEVDEVLHILWDSLNAAYQEQILPALFKATSQALVTAVHDRCSPVVCDVEDGETLSALASVSDGCQEVPGVNPAQWDEELEEGDEEDPHERCLGIHRGGDGEHYTCDGQPI